MLGQRVEVGAPAVTVVVQFTVHGDPAPGGSKTAVPFQRKTGRLGVRVFDAGVRNKAWREHVAAAAVAAMDSAEPLDGPLHVQAFFRRRRPKSVPDGTPCAKRPDATKLWRAVEDALTGIVWHDDSQVVSQWVGKEYESDEHGPGVTVTVIVANGSWCPAPRSLAAGDFTSGKKENQS